MARLYANENFPLPVVQKLRNFGHDVLTVREAGNADQAIPDTEVLAFAVAESRVVLTINITSIGPRMPMPGNKNLQPSRRRRFRLQQPVSQPGHCSE